MARPVKHDRVKILEAASKLFWERGYRGVSISDLVKETGMLAGSFYSSFGSKEGIFIECIHRYAAQNAEIYKAAQKAKSPLEQIENLMRNLVAESLKHDDRRACFIMNSLLELAPQNPKISEILRHYLGLSETWIEQRLDKAKETGELDPKTNSKDLAACLFGITYSLRLKARAKESPKRLRHYQKTVFAALVDPWRIKKVAQ